MTINKGLFAHISVTLILIAGYHFAFGLDNADAIDLFALYYLLALINVFMSAHFSEYGVYKSRIRL